MMMAKFYIQWLTEVLLTYTDKKKQNIYFMMNFFLCQCEEKKLEFRFCSSRKSSLSGWQELQGLLWTWTDPKGFPLETSPTPTPVILPRKRDKKPIALDPRILWPRKRNIIREIQEEESERREKEIFFLRVLSASQFRQPIAVSKSLCMYLFD